MSTVGVEIGGGGGGGGGGGIVFLCPWLLVIFGKEETFLDGVPFDCCDLFCLFSARRLDILLPLHSKQRDDNVKTKCTVHVCVISIAW